MRPICSITAVIIILWATATVAGAFEPMAATIRVAGGSLYDYVVIGEHPQATDGYDNVYDTISPGNLNAAMGQPYISVIVSQPEWKPAMRELRGDIRSLAKQQQWKLAITSSLPKDVPLKVTLQTDRSTLPKGMKLTLGDAQGNQNSNLAAGGYTFPAPGPGTTLELFIITEQP